MKRSKLICSLLLSTILTGCSTNNNNDVLKTSDEQVSESVGIAQDTEDNVIEEVVDETQVTIDLIEELMDRLENQEKVDAQIQSEIESGYYSPENPLMILDPYTQSPLTALICFSTDVPTRVEIHIEGEDEYTEVNHSFEELTTQHVIPVYGLYPDKLNLVSITLLDESGGY